MTDLSINGTDLGNFVSSTSAGLTNEFAQTGAGMKIIIESVPIISSR